MTLCRIIFFQQVILLLLFLQCRLAKALVPDQSPQKIAFLFMSRGAMPLEDIWHEFFRWHANSSHYSIYSHVHKGYQFPQSSFFSGKELAAEAREPLAVAKNGKGGGHLWGNMGQVRAIRSLVREALKDPLNQWFTLMSESCIPLYNFNTIRNALLKFDKSIINACPHMGIKEMEGDTRWRPGLDEVGFKLEHWRKSATWFALKRSHAQVFADDVSTDHGWEKVPCCDEHFLPSILAKHRLDNETTCTDGFTHVHWASVNDAHPTTYGADSISPEFFQHLASDVSGFAGSGDAAKLGLSTCSGVPNMCHLMARKFSPAAKYSLLENIDLILSDDEHAYEGNPWDHHQDKFRVNVTHEAGAGAGAGGAARYYLIEHGVLRLIPDNATLASLHHLRIDDEKGVDTHTLALTPLDLIAYPMGAPIPSRKDGLLIKAPKHNQVYVLEAGKRRAVPNMDTLMHLKLLLSNVKVLPDEDVQQIPLGYAIPDVNAPTKPRQASESGLTPRRHKSASAHAGSASTHVHGQAHGKGEAHELGDRGRDMQHNSGEIKRVQEKLRLSAAVGAGAGAGVGEAGGRVSSPAAAAAAAAAVAPAQGLEKWLYQSEATDENKAHAA